MAAPAWAPTADQVAKLSGPRTRGTDSIAARSATEQGEFNTTTRPTLAEVQDFIEQACDDVLAAFEGREPCTDTFERGARAAARYRAAALVEARVTPESVNQEGSAFEAFEAMFAQTLRGVRAGVVAVCPLPDGTPDPADQNRPLPPSGRGRNPAYPPLGLGTPW